MIAHPDDVAAVEFILHGIPNADFGPLQKRLRAIASQIITTLTAASAKRLPAEVAEAVAGDLLFTRLHPQSLRPAELNSRMKMRMRFYS